ncbi:MAG: hypothetical protein AABW58_01355 [Nanoarchaeota archaeon]
MLSKEIEKKILQFVYNEPRSVQDISKYIGKNWRTAESYVQKIIKESGNLAIANFREGTRAALKIVYFKPIENINSSEFQELLLKRLEAGRKKEDFSPFDIYNFVPEDKRSAKSGSYNISNQLFNQDLISFLRSAKKEILVFTGNCSFVSLKENDIPIISIFQEIAEKGVEIKVLSRVDFSSFKNLQSLLSINYSLGKELIEVRHCEQPLRGFLVDDTSFRLKEDIDPYSYVPGELSPDMKVVLYDIRDKEWVRWMREIFFKFFRTSISSQKRIKDLRSIKNQEVQSVLKF